MLTDIWKLSSTDCGSAELWFLNRGYNMNDGDWLKTVTSQAIFTCQVMLSPFEVINVKKYLPDGTGPLRSSVYWASGSKLLNFG